MLYFKKNQTNTKQKHINLFFKIIKDYFIGKIYVYKINITFHKMWKISIYYLDFFFLLSLLPFRLLIGLLFLFIFFLRVIIGSLNKESKINYLLMNCFNWNRELVTIK